MFDKRGDGRVAYDEGDKRECEADDEVGEAVGYHGAEDGAEVGVASLGDEPRAPHLAESRKDKVDGVCAEYAVQQVGKAAMYAYGVELNAPAQCAEHVAEEGDEQHDGYPCEVTLGVDNFEHGAEAIVAEHEPA